MPAITPTIRRAKGTIFVRVGKLEREFSDLASLRAWVEENRSRPTPDNLLADALVLLAKDARAASDLDALSGKTADVDAVKVTVR